MILTFLSAAPRFLHMVSLWQLFSRYPVILCWIFSPGLRCTSRLVFLCSWSDCVSSVVFWSYCFMMNVNSVSLEIWGFFMGSPGWLLWLVLPRLLENKIYILGRRYICVCRESAIFHMWLRKVWLNSYTTFFSWCFLEFVYKYWLFV